MGKSLVNGQVSIAMLNYQRVYVQKIDGFSIFLFAEDVEELT